MKTKLLLIAVLWATAFPGVAATEFTNKKSILIEGQSCLELEDHARAILRWTRSVHQNSKATLPQCYCSSNDCQIDVFEISPHWVKSWSRFSEYEAASAIQGPNCFNSALVIAGTLTDVRFTHPNEITALYNSSACRELNFNEVPKPGDIIAVRDQTNPHLEVHAATYVSDRLHFSKFGESFLMPYTYALDLFTNSAYRVPDPECRGIRGVPAVGSRCYNKPFANYFRCGSFSEYLGTLNFLKDMTEEVRAIYPAISNLEITVSRIVSRGRRATDTNEVLKGKVGNVRSTIAAAKQAGSLNSEEIEFIQLMQSRLTSLRGQLDRM